jgi:hypothetical protein
MAPAFIPAGYQAIPLGIAARLEDLGAFVPLEESSAEGALFLLRLDFSEYPSEESLAQLEQSCMAAGVEKWPGYGNIVFADLEKPSLYLAWQKGMPWLVIIGGLLATAVIPPLLGSLIWWLIPQDLKDLISGIINLGVMLLMIWLMTSLLKPLLNTTREKPRKLKATQRSSEEMEGPQA